MLNELDEQIKKYNELQKKEEEITAEKDILKNSILASMEAAGVTSYKINDGSLTVNVVTNNKITYTDEPAIIKYCENNNLNDYVVKKVNTTLLNKGLKKSHSLTESLLPFYEQKTIKYIKIVKE